MIIKTRSLTESLENKYKLDESPNSDYDLEDELDDLYDEEESDDKEFNDKLDTILNKYKFESLNGSLNESFVEEWWGQTEDNPKDLQQYGLKVTPLKRKNDETLYRFSGSLEDINKARNDGYFYSLEIGEDEDHSEDLNESKELNESIAGDIIWEKVRDVIREKIETEVIDNLAMVIQTEIPEYNPDWCAESSNQSQWAADKLAEELATELMFELE